MSISNNLAKWVVDFDLLQVPDHVIEDTKFRILDITGVMIAARTDPMVHQVRNALLRHSVGSVTTIGSPEKVSVFEAALFNGVLSSMLEFDDSHVETGIHSSGVIISALLPQSQLIKCNGQQLIGAMLIGAEIMARLAMVAPGYMHKNGFHPTSVFGIFGASYALGHLLDLTREQIVNAIGLSASLSSGLMASWQDGTSAKSMHVGFASSSAHKAVALSKVGITGPNNVFEGRFGFFPSFVQSRDTALNYSVLDMEKNKTWEVLNIASKAYPCGYVIQPCVECALIIAQAEDFEIEQIDSIVCHIAPHAIALVCEPVNEKVAPLSSWHARVSLQFSVAEALFYKKLDKFAYAQNVLINPSVLALANKVQYVSDPSASDRTILKGQVDIKLKNNRFFSHTVENMRGTVKNPSTREDFIHKFKSNTKDIYSTEKTEQMIDLILNIENMKDISLLSDLLSA